MKTLNFLHNFKICILVIKMNIRSLFVRKSVWLSLFLFSITLLFLFPFAFGTEVLQRFEVKIGCYWMIQEFVAALLILNMFKSEEEGRVFDLYGSTRSSKLSVFFGKVTFTTLHFFTLQLPLIILWAIIFNLDGQTLDQLWPRLLISSMFFSFTASLLGAFLYGITRRNDMKDLLQPLLFFSLQSTSLLASVGVCLEVQNSSLLALGSAWWNVMYIYPLLFIGLTLLFGDSLLEE